MRTLSVAGSTWGASLITTIKTHKGNGFIEHRNIHAAANPKCRGLSFWVSGVLDDELKQLPHLLMSSEHLVSLLPGVVIQPGDKLVRIDLKHFFMSGSVASLSNGASAIVGNRAKHMLVKAVLDFLIFEQFIQSKYLPNRLWRVVKGSVWALCTLLLFVMHACTLWLNDHGLAAWRSSGSSGSKCLCASAMTFLLLPLI